MIYLTHDRFEDFQSVWLHIQRHYGSNTYVELVLIYDPISQIRGEWIEEAEVVVVNLRQHESIAEIIQTMIHEYIHTIQPEYWGDDWRAFETVAEQIALTDYHLFM